MNRRLFSPDKAWFLVAGGAALFAFIVAFYFSNGSERPADYFLAIRMSSSIADTAQVFFDAGAGYKEEISRTVRVAPGEISQVLRFHLPSGHIKSIRFDALNKAGRITISSGSIITDSGQIIHSFTPDDFVPVNCFRVVEKTSSQVVLEAFQPAGRPLDPIIIISHSNFSSNGTPVLFQKVIRAIARWTVIFFLAVLTLVIAVIAVRRFLHSRIFIDPESQFITAVVFSAAFNFLHAMCLPLVASYDGMEYTHLATVLFSSTFPSAWNFLRSPLFPLALKEAFLLGGTQPQAALMVTLPLGLGGIWLLGLSVRRLSGGTLGAVVIAVLTVYPVLIGYQHMLLSETGIMFFLALLVWTCVRLHQIETSGFTIHACIVAGALAAGYYWRPTILYLSPVAGALCIFARIFPDGPADGYDGFLKHLKRRLPRVLPAALIVAVVPWLMALPWLRLTAKYSPGAKDMVLSLGMYKQVVVPPDDPALKLVRAQYEHAIKKHSKNGSLPLDGIAVVDTYDLSIEVSSAIQRAGAAKLIKKYPLRYAGAVVKSAEYFLGIPWYRSQDDENGNLTGAILAIWPSSEDMSAIPGWNSDIAGLKPEKYGGGALMGRALASLLPAYTWLVWAGALSSLFLLFYALVKRETVLLTLTLIPLSFVLMHALTTLAEDRYAFPVYPLFLTNLILAIKLTAETLIRRGRGNALKIMSRLHTSHQRIT